MTFKERLFLAMAARPTWFWWLTTFLFIFVLVFLWWFLSYRDLSAQLSRVEQHIREHEQQRTHQTLLAQKQATAQADTQNRATLVRKAWEDFFVCKHVTTFVEQLVRAAQEQHLQLTSYRLSEPQKEAYGSRVELTCEISGDFFSLISLLEQFEAMTNVIGLGCDLRPLPEGRVRCKCKFSLSLAEAMP